MSIEKKFRYDGDEKFVLNEWKTNVALDSSEIKEADIVLEKDIKKLTLLQEKLYASDKYGVIIIFQAMDAAGKDGTIQHVMSGVNPQGCQVSCFKSPTPVELNHDYLWRINKELPERGKIGIFNRSYYEEVLVTKVHPELILAEKLPDIISIDDINERFWIKRYKQIRNYENYLTDNGYIILKFFLHLSKDEQKARFLSRIENPNKNWKLSESDFKERTMWNEYQEAYHTAIQKTATKKNPWYIIPADCKKFMRAAVSNIIVKRLSELEIEYPKASEMKKIKFQQIREELLLE